MTVLITLSCVINYVLNPNIDRTLVTEMAKVYDSVGLLDAKKDLFNDFCLNEKEDLPKCLDLSKVFAEYQTSMYHADHKFALAKDLKGLKEYHALNIRFSERLLKPTPEFEELKNYNKYKDADTKAKEILSEYDSREKLLTLGTLNPTNLLRAQFLHGFPLHIIGNLLVFIPLAVYVEQRLGAVLFLLLYLFGGTMGMLTQIYLSPLKDQVVLGASANIAGVMGLFLAFYYRFQVRVFIWNFAAKSFFAPVWIVFPVLYVLQDLIGGIENLNGGGGVAHLAHLGGFVSGALAGLVVRAISPVPWPFIIKDEMRQFEELKVTKDLKQEIENGIKLLDCNPQNSVVRDFLIGDVFKKLQKSGIAEAIPFLRVEFRKSAAEKMAKGNLDDLFLLVKTCPVILPFVSFFGNWRETSILKLGDYGIQKKDYILALRCYDYFLTLYPRSSQAAKVQMSCREIVNQIEGTQDLKLQLKDLIANQPATPVAKMMEVTYAPAAA